MSLGLAVGKATTEGPEGHVFEQRRHEELVVGVLEDQAHSATNLGQVLPAHHQAADADRAGAGLEYPVELQEQRALARAVRPNQGDVLARRHGQRET